MKPNLHTQICCMFGVHTHAHINIDIYDEHVKKSPELIIAHCSTLTLTVTVG